MIPAGPSGAGPAGGGGFRACGAARAALCVLFLAGAAAAQDAPPPADPGPPPPSWTYQRGRIEKDGMVTIFYQVRQGRGPQVMPFVQKFLTPKGSILVSPAAPPNQPDLRLMMIQDVKENIDLVEKVLNIVDRPMEQVQIEAQIVEKSIDNDLDVGFELRMEQDPGHSRDEFLRDATGTFHPDAFLQSLAPGALPFQGLNLGLFNENHQWGIIDLRIRALIRRGKATVLSSPYVTVNNGESATIVAGDEVPFVELININNGIANSTVKFKQAAVRLVVVPHVIGGNYIDLDVKPEVTSVSGTVNISGTTTPVFSTRNADTHLTVKDGQQIIIGGLVRTEETETRRGVPILADIPVIGYLFGSTQVEKRKTEILFILRPRILRPEAAELVLPARRK